MAASMTAEEIIETALRQAGNPTIPDLGRIWLANGLDRLWEDVKWPFLETNATGVLGAGQTAVPLPEDFGDFWGEYSLRLEKDGSFIALAPITSDDMDNMIGPNVRGGMPATVLVDLSAMTWRPWPVADQAYTWHLRYRRKPSRLVFADDEEELSTFIADFNNDELLIQMVFVKALQHEDDDRFPQENQLLEQMVRRYLAGFNTSPLKGNTVRLNRRTFRQPLWLR